MPLAPSLAGYVLAPLPDAPSLRRLFLLSLTSVLNSSLSLPMALPNRVSLTSVLYCSSPSEPDRDSPISEDEELLVSLLDPPPPLSLLLDPLPGLTSPPWAPGPGHPTPLLDVKVVLGQGGACARRTVPAKRGVTTLIIPPPPPVSRNRQCLTAEPRVGSCAHFPP